MPQYNQIPIRIQLSLTSNPPVSPIDANTGQQPQFWRAQDMDMQIGIFDSMGNPVDLSNLTYLQVILQPAYNSITPSVVKTVAAMNLNTLITRGNWDAGIAQNADVLFTAADLDLSLSADPSQLYWLVIQGLTSTGQLLSYGAGNVLVYNPGYQLPPPAPSGLVSEHEQTNAGGNTTVTPTSQLHTEKITFTGAARTSAVIVGASGLVAGARPVVLVLLPATAGIVVQVWNQTIATGSPLFSVVTDGYLRQACFEMGYDGSNLYPLRATVPAF